jgi:hypothetical protein
LLWMPAEPYIQVILAACKLRISPRELAQPVGNGKEDVTGYSLLVHSVKGRYLAP